ncbi:MAG TPA: glycine zipper 2TM domain-containing protein [Gammaproteobacteria bacterium]|nr:glycine zipper 2TM domain-containing protein [Gammaproteobacteria bacterium]
MKGINIISAGALAGALLALGGCAPRNTVQPVQPVQPAYNNTAPAYNNGSANCYNCATVTDIQPIPEGSGGNATGAVIGAIVGAAVGHQFGGGRGQTAATVGGAAAGAYAGSQYANGDEYDYRVTVRTDSGETRTFVLDDPPNYGVGTRVRLNSSY